jgi:hypothetical protein
LNAEISDQMESDEDIYDEDDNEDANEDDTDDGVLVPVIEDNVLVAEDNVPVAEDNNPEGKQGSGGEIDKLNA